MASAIFEFEFAYTVKVELTLRNISPEVRYQATRYERLDTNDPFRNLDFHPEHDRLPTKAKSKLGPMVGGLRISVSGMAGIASHKAGDVVGLTAIDDQGLLGHKWLVESVTMTIGFDNGWQHQLTVSSGTTPREALERESKRERKRKQSDRALKAHRKDQRRRRPRTLRQVARSPRRWRCTAR